jgi:hypothetical protein
MHARLGPHLQNGEHVEDGSIHAPAASLGPAPGTMPSATPGVEEILDDLVALAINPSFDVGDSGMRQAVECDLLDAAIQELGINPYSNSVVVSGPEQGEVAQQPIHCVA